MKMFGKKRNSESTEAPAAVDDESPYDLAALEAESDAAYKAAENGEEWDGRDPKVIENELHEALRAARVAAELNTGADGNITRREFEEFKSAVAIVFMGIEAALREPNVSPRRVLNLISTNFTAMGFSRAQAKELADFERRTDVVGKQYSDWDLRTKSQREYALRDAALRRPRFG